MFYLSSLSSLSPETSFGRKIAPNYSHGVIFKDSSVITFTINNINSIVERDKYIDI